MAKLFPIVSWANGVNIYEVNIRQYTAEGTFKSFQQHLPRLQQMGVRILWLMPITPISLEGRKGTLGSYYAASSYTQTNPEYGTIDDLKSLIDDAHEKGMKLIIDWVANHTGCGHEWKAAHPDWYEKNAKGEFYDENGWDDVIDLNYRNVDMRKEMIRSMQFWINKCGIDGFRCDMAHLVPLDFWKEARAACDEMKSLFWLAETENNEYHNVFDATYAWSWMHVSERYYRGEATLYDFKNELLKFEELPADCYKLLFTTNHDENSWNGTEYEKYGEAVKALAVLCCTYKTMPLVYCGQELPSKKRLKFFDKDEIEWHDAPALHTFYQTLLQARNNTAALRYGDIEMLTTSANDKVLAYVRKYQDSQVLVLLNLSAAEKLTVQIQHESFTGIFQSIFSGLQYEFKQEMEFELEPWGWLVYKK